MASLAFLDQIKIDISNLSKYLARNVRDKEVFISIFVLYKSALKGLKDYFR